MPSPTTGGAHRPKWYGTQPLPISPKKKSGSIGVPGGMGQGWRPPQFQYPQGGQEQPPAQQPQVPQPGIPPNYGYPWSWLTDPANVLLTPWSYYGLTAPTSPYGAAGIAGAQQLGGAGGAGGGYTVPSWYEPWNVGQNWQDAMNAAAANYGGKYPGWYSGAGQWMGSSMPSGSAKEPTSYYYSPYYGMGAPANSQAGMMHKIGAKGGGGHAAQANYTLGSADWKAESEKIAQWRAMAARRRAQMGGTMGGSGRFTPGRGGGGGGGGSPQTPGSVAGWVQNMVNWRP